MDIHNHKFGMEQVKNEVDSYNSNETFQTVFIKCERYDDENSSEIDFVDHKNATTCSCIEQNEKNVGGNKPNSEYIDHTKVSEVLPKNECNQAQVKNENDIDILYEDIEHENVKEKFIELDRFCGVCKNSFNSEMDPIDSKIYRLECNCRKQNYSINLQDEDMTRDVNGPSLGLTTDSTLQLLRVQDKTISEDERSNKQISTSAPQNDSVSPLEFHKELKSTNIPDDIFLSTSKYCSVLDETDLVTHETSDKAEKKFQCGICSKSLNNAHYLKVHERIHTGEKPFHCKICSKSFISNSILNSHSKIHSGAKPFHCKVCSKSFITNGQLNVHSVIHSGEKNFHCKLCSKSFSYSHQLKVHGRIHSGEKPFHCKVCLKSFGHSHGLKNHERIHSEENPFHCTICSKSYLSNDSLRHHFKVHTGDKPFNCTFCSKSFYRASHLKPHLKIHTGEKPFLCEICSKSFNKKDHLKNHSLIHTGEKPFKCELCSKSYFTNSSLKTHLKIHTEESPL